MRSTSAALTAAATLAATLASGSAPAAAGPGIHPGAGSPAAGDVVISEFAPAGPWGSTDEYVVLRNTTNQAVSLGGWEIGACTPLGELTPIILGFGVEIQAGGFMLLAGSGHVGSLFPEIRYLGNVPEDGGWRILDALGGHVDGVGLVEDLPCTEGEPAPQCNWASSEAVARDGQHTDTDNNADDFTCRARSPGL